MPAALRTMLTSPARFCALMLAITLLGLGLDHFATLGWQMLLALGTWIILFAVCVPLTPEERARTAVVIVVATCAEIVGSIIWGIYEYRLGNLPLFVPAGHGLVYLTGLRISRTAWVLRHRRPFIAGTLTILCGWGALGLTGVLGRYDIAGAIGCATLAVFILRGRAPTIYAGVFLAVAVLEIYGTAVGTWRWAETIPGLGVPDGNPPSGAASGYVLFDICALAFAPKLLALVRWTGGRLTPAAPRRRGVGSAKWPAYATVSPGSPASGSSPSPQPPPGTAGSSTTATLQSSGTTGPAHGPFPGRSSPSSQSR